MENNNAYSETENNFLRSLQQLTPDDIAPEVRSRKKIKVSDIIRKTAATLCFCVFLWSAYELITSLYNYKRGDDIYASIAEDFYNITEENTEGDSVVLKAMRSPKNPTTLDFSTALLSGKSSEEIEIEEYNEEFERVKARLHALSTKYGDLYGWITITDTNIDYPILQYTDNEYYLNHAATGDYLPAGSIFADYRCSKTLLENRNFILYGHNMANGLMFNNVMKYLQRDYFEENKYITVSTFDGIYTYYVFSIRQADMYSNYIQTKFKSDADAIAFMEEMESLSLFHRDDISFDENSRILTLSTCTNISQSGRYCLQALLVDINN